MYFILFFIYLRGNFFRDNSNNEQKNEMKNTIANVKRLAMNLLSVHRPQNIICNREILTDYPISSY